MNQQPWKATLSLLVPLAFFPTWSAATTDYPYCDTVVRDVDGSISLHPECLDPPPGGTDASIPTADSGFEPGPPPSKGGGSDRAAATTDYPYCDTVVREVDGSISLHPECLDPPPGEST